MTRLDVAASQLLDLARVYVPAHVRVVDGKTQNVDGYWREGPDVVPSDDPARFSTEEAYDWGAALYGDWETALSKDEREGLTDYKVTGYRWINSILRGNAEEMRAEWNAGEGYEDVTKEDLQRMYDQWIPHIDSAFKSAPKTDQPIVVYRGATERKYKVGDEFTDPAFVSTSLTPERAEDFVSWQNEKAEWGPEDGGPFPKGQLMEVIVPAGTKAAYLDVLPDVLIERELLLDRGLTYRVVSVDPLRVEVVSGD